MGWKNFVSEREAAITPFNRTTFDYDWAGRQITIHPPDHNSPTTHGHDVTLSYAGSRIVNRTVRVAMSQNGGRGQVCDWLLPSRQPQT
jgi:hypothetical protein